MYKFMKLSTKTLRLIPFILLASYYLIKSFYPQLIRERELVVLVVMIVISSISVGILFNRKSFQKAKRQKIIMLSLGLLGTFITAMYFLNVV